MKIAFSIDVEIEVPADSNRQKHFKVGTGRRELLYEFEQKLPHEWKVVLSRALQEHAHAVSFVGAALNPE
jgi:hypothetical protein